jgi:hypothetical protein
MKNQRLSQIAMGAVSLITLTVMLAVATEPEANFKPKDGYVPNAETAARIAEAVWTPIYGANVIEREKPFKTVLKGEIWFVEGTLQPLGPGGSIENLVGGVAMAEIAKDDGRILRVIHGK